MTDVLLYQTDDDGEVNISGGVVELSSGLETAVYVSLFGGNEDDAGGGDETLSWWGNDGELQQYRSRTQHMLRSIPPIPANLRRIEDAGNSDLAWMLKEGAASSVDVAASMPGLNRVSIVVTIDGDQQLTYSENWRASV